MADELVITNARIVTCDEEFFGSLHVDDGRIAAVSQGATAVAAQDWNGDYLLPGLIELHTDNVEKHLMPRPGVRWPVLPALLSHDAQIASAGITTVFDALALGDFDAGSGSIRAQNIAPIIAALRSAREQGMLRADHLLHLRCEIACANVVELLQPFDRDPMVRMISIMDHTPGQRQWTDMDKFRIYYQRHETWSDAKTQSEIEHRKSLQRQYADINRQVVVAMCRGRAVPLASHDDTTVEHVEQAVAEGASISEFPTTLAAARAAREHALGIVMGAPNVVRGESHSGNVSALELARTGLLDVLSSDYVPASLLHAAFLLVEHAGFSVPAAVATVSANPARLARLEDRGEIACGKRADFARVRVREGIPAVLAVWSAGRRIV